MKRIVVPVFLFAATAGAQGTKSITAEVQAVYPRAEALYIDLHKTPEMSWSETETSGEARKGAARDRVRGDDGSRPHGHRWHSAQWSWADVPAGGDAVFRTEG